MSHHDDHHTEEKKPVSFAVPFILACVTLTAILSLVSLGDPCHCKEACASECCAEEKHDGGATHGTEAQPATEKAPAEHGGH